MNNDRVGSSIWINTNHLMMSIVTNRIASRLVDAHCDILERGGESTFCVVRLDDLSFLCEAAICQQAQIVGLQKYASIPDNFGMVFPYRSSPRRVSFHMGSVSFPIDILFERNGRVARIIHSAKPGSSDIWSEPDISNVIEVSGGTCNRCGIDMGSKVAISIVRMAQEKFDPSQQRVDWHTRRPLFGPPYSYNDRFRDRDLLDEQMKNMPFDQTHYEELDGYDVVTLHDEKEYVPPIRPSASKLGD